ncbi:MAG TPA: 3-hydroxybutyrate dehydrogenase [Burkholderiaceae bacterium]|nr:3-hydroxybutyrate dehydrogenase [Burkholderiaceae bacterium]
MLEGKVALVTGSTSGIGLGIARALAAQRARVILNGFGEPQEIERLRETVARETGATVAFEGGDLMRPQEIESLMQRCAERHGGVDILVNNAGIQHVATTERFPVERWDAVIALNLSAAFHTSRLALPTMKSRNWGRIINIASVHGLVASVEKAAYIAAKHGIIGLTKVVALENARTGVTCNAICPGWVLTPLVQKQIDARKAERGLSEDEAKAALLGEKQPSLEFVTPQQIGELAVFLCSPAAAQVRGAAWTIDGGWTAQ